MTNAPDNGLWIIGSGGHAKVVTATALAAGVTVAGLLDERPERLGCTVLGVTVTGTMATLRDQARAVIAIGRNAARESVALKLPTAAWSSVVHPTAFVAEGASVGSGTVVFALAVVQPGATVGDHVIINTAAIIEHDCHIGDLAHVASGVVLGGGVSVGRGALLGSGATILRGRRVGEWSTVGAGAVVIDDVRDGATVVGVPAREV